MSGTGPIGAPAAGTHLLADFWGGRTIDSVEELDALVRSAVASAGATLLDLAFHQFPAHDALPAPGEPGAGEGPEGAGAGLVENDPAAGGAPAGGITGYALLAESHISVHTWPERGYTAIDVFMCGEQRPERALQIMRRAFAPTRERVHTVRRGAEEEAVETRSAPEGLASTRPAPVSPVSGRPASEALLAVGPE